MKTAIFISCVFVGGSLLYNSSPAKTSKTFTSYKVSKAKKTTAKPVGFVRIVIDKSDYELTVYDEQGWYATYPVVFGNNSLLDKKNGRRQVHAGGFIQDHCKKTP